MEGAKLEAEALVTQTRAECRSMVQEAQELRARVLADLARRRRVLHSQIEQLRAGRERLAETIGDVRVAVDQITDELFRAEDEARLAAEAAGRQAAQGELSEAAIEISEGDSPGELASWGRARPAAVGGGAVRASAGRSRAAGAPDAGLDEGSVAVTAVERGSGELVPDDFVESVRIVPGPPSGSSASAPSAPAPSAQAPDGRTRRPLPGQRFDPDGGLSPQAGHEAGQKVDPGVVVGGARCSGRGTNARDANARDDLARGKNALGSGEPVGRAEHDGTEPIVDPVVAQRDEVLTRWFRRWPAGSSGRCKTTRTTSSTACGPRGAGPPECCSPKTTTPCAMWRPPPINDGGRPGRGHLRGWEGRRSARRRRRGRLDGIGDRGPVAPTSGGCGPFGRRR